MKELKLEGKKLFYGDVELGLTYREVDGFYVFTPTGSGYYDSWMLKKIAGIIDERNRHWEYKTSKDIAL